MNASENAARLLEEEARISDFRAERARARDDLHKATDLTARAAELRDAAKALRAEGSQASRLSPPALDK